MQRVVAETVDRFGGLDVVVANAGVRLDRRHLSGDGQRGVRPRPGRRHTRRRADGRARDGADRATRRACRRDLVDLRVHERGGDGALRHEQGRGRAVRPRSAGRAGAARRERDGRLLRVHRHRDGPQGHRRGPCRRPALRGAAEGPAQAAAAQGRGGGDRARHRAPRAARDPAAALGRCSRFCAASSTRCWTATWSATPRRSPSCGCSTAARARSRSSPRVDGVGDSAPGDHDRRRGPAGPAPAAAALPACRRAAGGAVRPVRPGDDRRSGGGLPAPARPSRGASGRRTRRPGDLRAGGLRRRPRRRPGERRPGLGQGDNAVPGLAADAAHARPSSPRRSATGAWPRTSPGCAPRGWSPGCAISPTRQSSGCSRARAQTPWPSSRSRCPSPSSRGCSAFRRATSRASTAGPTRSSRASTPVRLLASTRRALRSVAGALALHRYMKDVFARLRREPGDDVLSALLASQEGGELGDAELFWLSLMLLVAGNETTTNLIGSLLFALAKDPEAYARLRAEPELIPSAVEEALRWGSPIQSFFRTVTADYTVGATTIPAGARVLLLFGAANRDPRKYADPDRFVIDRNPTDHVGFGMGIHFCLGAQLARAEARVALESLVRPSRPDRPGRTRRLARQPDRARAEPPSDSGWSRCGVAAHFDWHRGVTLRGALRRARMAGLRVLRLPAGQPGAGRGSHPGDLRARGPCLWPLRPAARKPPDLAHGDRPEPAGRPLPACGDRTDDARRARADRGAGRRRPEQRGTRARPEPALESALATLSEREREIIALRYGGDLTGPEIAEIQGLTLANVQQILSRSLRRMRDAIEEGRAALAAGDGPTRVVRRGWAATPTAPRPVRHGVQAALAVAPAQIWGRCRSRVTRRRSSPRNAGRRQRTVARSAMQPPARALALARLRDAGFEVVVAHRRKLAVLLRDSRAGSRRSPRGGRRPGLPGAAPARTAAASWSVPCALRRVRGATAPQVTPALEHQRALQLAATCAYGWAGARCRARCSAGSSSSAAAALWLARSCAVPASGTASAASASTASRGNQPASGRGTRPRLAARAPAPPPRAARSTPAVTVTCQCQSTPGGDGERYARGGRPRDERRRRPGRAATLRRAPAARRAASAARTGMIPISPSSARVSA